MPNRKSIRTYNAHRTRAEDPAHSLPFSSILGAILISRSWEPNTHTEKRQAGKSQPCCRCLACRTRWIHLRASTKADEIGKISNRHFQTCETTACERHKTRERGLGGWSTRMEHPPTIKINTRNAQNTLQQRSTLGSRRTYLQRHPMLTWVVVPSAPVVPRVPI